MINLSKLKNYWIQENNFREENDILIGDYVRLKGKVINFVVYLNFEKFSKDLLNGLFYTPFGAKFLDRVGTKENLKNHNFFGEIGSMGSHITPLLDKNPTRQPAYEKKLVFRELPSGKYEIEWEISFRLASPYSKTGFFAIDFEVVNRGADKKEIINKDNQKEVLYGGKWEIRSKQFDYYNTVVRDVLNKIPIIKNSDFLKNVYLNFYGNRLDDDLWHFENKIIPYLSSLLEKHKLGPI